MSSVSGIGGNAQSIYQFIQSLSGNSSTPSTSSTSGTSSTSSSVAQSIGQAILGGGTPGASSAAETDGDNDASATSTSPTINTQNFFQTLQSYGVSPQQFQQDLLSAVRDAQNGTVNGGTAFQSFPPGSILNTVGSGLLL